MGRNEDRRMEREGDGQHPEMEKSRRPLWTGQLGLRNWVEGRQDWKGQARHNSTWRL
jgi:hypothetical protein